MMRLLEEYLVDVDYPTVSGIEHLDMLEKRTQLAVVEDELSSDEKQALALADQKLLSQVEQFHAELQRFVNLDDERKSRSINPDWWWWYLDVLVKVPTFSPGNRNTDPVST